MAWRNAAHARRDCGIPATLHALPLFLQRHENKLQPERRGVAAGGRAAKRATVRHRRCDALSSRTSLGENARGVTAWRRVRRDRPLSVWHVWYQWRARAVSSRRKTMVWRRQWRTQRGASLPPHRLYHTCNTPLTMHLLRRDLRAFDVFCAQPPIG